MSEIAPDDLDQSLERHFRTLRVPMSRDAFYCLPTNGAYKYEYVDGIAQITPQPHFSDLYLELDAFSAPARHPLERLSVRPLVESDWDVLSAVAAAAFYRVAPFATFDDRQLGPIVADGFHATRGGRHGQLIPDACLVAEATWGGEDKIAPVAAALVTLRPGQTNDGAIVPLLVWIFVSPMFKRHGIAGGLLAAVVRLLKQAGHRRLESVICTGNHASAMWHWHMGFKMGPTLREKVTRSLTSK